MYKRLLASVREYKKASILSPIFVTGEVIMECVIPLFMAKLIDEMNGGSLENVWKYAAILVSMAVLSLIFGIFAGKYCSLASAGFAKNLRNDLFKKISEFSFANIDKFSYSSLVTRVTTDVTNVQQAFLMAIRSAFRAPLMLIFSIVMAFTISFELAWIYVVIAPIVGFILIFIAAKVHPLFEKVFIKYDNLNNSIEENITGIRVVKSFVREDYEKEKFDKAASDVCKDFTKAERIMSLSQPSLTFAIYIVNILLIFLGAMIIVKTSNIESGEIVWGDLSTGQLSSLMTYGIQVLMALMVFSMTFVMIIISVASIKRIAEVLNEESTLTNPENPIYEIEDGSIEFKNVSFKYSEHAKKDSLKNINLSIKSGETIGIIGSTGSAKTTLVNLISRLYDATTGEVLVSSRNVKDYDIETLRNQVSVVLQKNLLFSGTIASNLRWGNENATDSELAHACDIACASEFIEQFPDKYETKIEQGGSNVSGGQKQRLCIARALLKKPKILILDDSTSAVDTKTDSKIRTALKTELPGLTKIIIAQRISSICDSDQIIVMNNGTIEAIGNHESLLATNEIYREVYTTQNSVGGEAHEE